MPGNGSDVEATGTHDTAHAAHLGRVDPDHRSALPCTVAIAFRRSGETAAAEAVVRRPCKTSERTWTRCISRSLIATQPTVPLHVVNQGGGHFYVAQGGHSNRAPTRRCRIRFLMLRDGETLSWCLCLSDVSLKYYDKSRPGSRRSTRRLAKSGAHGWPQGALDKIEQIKTWRPLRRLEVPPAASTFRDAAHPSSR